jgi:hypothetical protein
MKTIIVDTYPATLLFKVRKELPEFKFNCPVRNKILHYQMKKQQVDSPCHLYTDYGVDSIEITPYGEIWQVGS